MPASEGKRRLVIKIGTSTLTYENGSVNIRRIEALCKTVSDIKNSGHEVILVSSGAIGMGVGKLRLPKRPSDLAGKQACAAVGQCELMYTYDKLFAEYNHTVAHILLTSPDLKCEDRHAKFSSTMTRLLDYGVLPIINENDTVSTEEIEFGDNDTLAAMVAESVGANLLVLLSDIDGLYTADPRTDSSATLVKQVFELTDEIMASGSGAGTSRGTGGMQTKLRAAKISTDAGCDMIISNGSSPELLYDIVEGREVGTRFYSRKG
ncbi:MAG: glutamate 5-kinase [Clostridia bacterium]|nr:glutamate 5-kinase [Clostridia bacterium]